MIVLGVTGTIASGKSTTAGFLTEAGVPVFSADAAVHALYAGPGVRAVGRAFPTARVNGVIDRARLAAAIMAEPYKLAELEKIIHPLVAAEERAFLDEARTGDHAVAVVELPLLYEIRADKRVDKVLVTTAPAAVRETRALTRPGMTIERYRLLSARQLPDAEKRQRADYVIDTDRPLDAVRNDVRTVLTSLRAAAPARAD